MENCLPRVCVLFSWISLFVSHSLHTQSNSHTESESGCFHRQLYTVWRTAFLEYVFCFHGFVSLHLIRLFFYSQSRCCHLLGSQSILCLHPEVQNLNCLFGACRNCLNLGHISFKQKVGQILLIFYCFIVFIFIFYYCIGNSLVLEEKRKRKK